MCRLCMCAICLDVIGIVLISLSNYFIACKEKYQFNKVYWLCKFVKLKILKTILDFMLISYTKIMAILLAFQIYVIYISIY